MDYDKHINYAKSKLKHRFYRFYLVLTPCHVLLTVAIVWSFFSRLNSEGWSSVIGLGILVLFLVCAMIINVCIGLLEILRFKNGKAFIMVTGEIVKIIIRNTLGSDPGYKDWFIKVIAKEERTGKKMRLGDVGEYEDIISVGGKYKFLRLKYARYAEILWIVGEGKENNLTEATDEEKMKNR